MEIIQFQIFKNQIIWSKHVALNSTNSEFVVFQWKKNQESTT